MQIENTKAQLRKGVLENSVSFHFGEGKEVRF